MDPDIYCSKQDDNGDWLEPVNQGPNINTAAEEFHFTQDSDGTGTSRRTDPVVLGEWISMDQCNRAKTLGIPLTT